MPSLRFHQQHPTDFTLLYEAELTSHSKREREREGERELKEKHILPPNLPRFQMPTRAEDENSQMEKNKLKAVNPPL